MLACKKQGLFIFLALMLGPSLAQSETDKPLTVAIGAPGSDSFTFGTELWAMSQIALAPGHGIGFEAREVAADGDRLDLLRTRDVEAALIYERVPTSDAGDLRAVMALWPQGLTSNEVEPVRLLVREDVPDDTIYQITKAIFEHSSLLRSAHATLGIGLPSQAMTGLDVPLHPGAYRYYEEKGFGFDTSAGDGGSLQTAAGSEQGTVQADAATYRNFDDAALNRGEIAQIVAACRQALDQGSLSAVLGDLSTTGCEVYQESLMESQADQEAIEKPSPSRPDGQQSADGQAQALAVIATSEQMPVGSDVEEDSTESGSGQGGPAIVWPYTGGNRSTPVGGDARAAMITRQPVM